MIRTLEPQDANALMALHSRVFGGEATRAWYEWKYGQLHDEGRGLGSGLWMGNDLVAHCGGVPRTLWVKGQRMQGLQIGDVMVDPAWRGVLARRSPFFQVSQHFYGLQVGAGRPFEAGFGFPSERHLKLAKLLGLLGDGGKVLGLGWNVTQRPIPLATRWGLRLEAVDALTDRGQAILAEAWAAQRAGSEGLVLGDRDARYLAWRFARRPDQKIQMWSVRPLWHRRPVGVVVLGWAGPGQMQWLDWIGPPHALDQGGQAMLHVAAKQGVQGVQAWATPAVVAHMLHCVPNHCTEVVRLGLVAGTVWPEGREPDGREWWLMGGDTDFL